MVTSDNYPEMLRIQVPKIVAPQQQSFMQRACARGDECESLGVPAARGDERGDLRAPADIPANPGTEDSERGVGTDISERWNPIVYDVSGGSAETVTCCLVNDGLVPVKGEKRAEHTVQEAEGV